jgi:hypothetical protein
MTQIVVCMTADVAETLGNMINSGIDEELVEEESEDILMKNPPEEVVAEIKISNQPTSENIPEN